MADCPVTPEQTIQRLREQIGPRDGMMWSDVLTADLTALLAVAEAAETFCNTRPDWDNPGVQRAYGELRTALARLAGERPGE